MTRTDRSSIMLRVQEVIHRSPSPITAHDALKQVLTERYGDDPNGLLDFAAGAGQSLLRGLRKSTYNLNADAGAALFDIPSVIAITDSDTELFLSRDEADLGQVRQWAREGTQHHAVQSLRFTRLVAEIETLKEEPDGLPWMSARDMLHASLGTGQR